MDLFKGNRWLDQRDKCDLFVCHKQLFEALFGDEPDPPNPLQTAAAQTGTNVSTAVANTVLNAMNQVTPQGNLTYSRDGNFSWTDPSTNQTYSIPQFTATQTETPQQRLIRIQREGAQLNLATLANQQAGDISDWLNQAFNPGAGAPAAGNAATIGQGNPLTSFGNVGGIYTSAGSYLPQLSSFSTGGSQQQTLGNAGSIGSTFGATPGISMTLNAFGQPQLTFGQAGNVQRSLAGSGRQATTFGGAGGIATTLSPFGSVQGSFAPSGSQQTTFGPSGAITSNLTPAGTVQGTFGQAGNIARGYGPADNFSADRRRVEESLFNRMNPELQRDRENLEQRLADQGIRYGSPAYQAAMDDFNRQTTDARLAVTAAGGAEQQRMMDMAAQEAGFQNAAQQQAYNQAQGRAAFANTAQAQRFAQSIGVGQFKNAAQAQQFAQALQRGEFANEAQARRFAQNLQTGQFANAATAQRYAQSLGVGQFRNAAQAQQFAQAMNRGEFANAAQARQYAQNLQTGQFVNAAQQQAFAQAQERGQFMNAAQAQRYAQSLGVGQFRNTAQAQMFAQAMQRGQFANAAQAQRFAQLVQRGTFRNTAQAQQYLQNQQRATFANQARATNLNQQIQVREFANQAQAQRFGQAGTRAQFYNAGIAQRNANAERRFNAMQSARNQYLQEQYQLRGQPLNEISALMSGSQLSNPNWLNTPSSQIPTTDVAGLINTNFQQQFQNYQQSSQNINQLISGILGAGGRLGSAAITASDRKVKTDVGRIGAVFAEGEEDGEAKRLPIYRYRYKGERDDGREHVGPMAQDVEKIRPSAVVTRGGVKHIDLTRMGGVWGMAA